MSNGRRLANPEEYEGEQISARKIAIVIAVIVVLIAVVSITVYMVKKGKTEETNTGVNETEQQAVKKETIPAQYEGYSVLGKLVIEKIGLDKFIVDSTEDSAMAKAPAKLYGDTLNENGNFCIAGHNYDEVFAKLNELQVGDKFYIMDKKENKQDYEVKEVLEVEPTDLKILMPVEDKIQVTLITCIEGATKRLVIRAEAVDIEG